MITLTLENAPDEGLNLVRRIAPLVIGRQKLESADDPQIGAPWPVHSATIPMLKEGQLTAARRTAWQYPVYAADDMIAVAEIGSDPIEWAALRPSEYADGIVSAAAALLTLFESVTGAFVFRLLRIPGAALVLIWLHGSTDTFVPVDMGPSTEVMHRAMSQAEILAAVQPRLAALLNATGSAGA